ncbi:uncharacterized protein LOC131349010 [Hemibagrus wyckioides]|nr:uncharacterized protein LOC131349010 [Hemibagrus wyckioides]
MPKASCTICRKMVPLQALPVHIKSCRKENIDLCSTSEDEAFTQDHLPPVCPENQAELTAECPVCRGAFDIDVTETHASDCGLRAIVLHSAMRVVPMLDQLRKGLQLYDLLTVMKTHPDLCLSLFVPGEDDRVDAAFVLEKCQPDFSEKGSVKYNKEINIMNFFQDFLQEIEDCEQGGRSDQESSEALQEVTVGRIMQWMTGQAHKPVLPSEKKDFIISVKFYHDCDTSYHLFSNCK